MTNPTWSSVEIDPTLLTNRGYQEIITVNGQTYERFIGYMVAGIAEAEVRTLSGTSGLFGTSATFMETNAGTKTLTTQTGKYWVAGMILSVTAIADADVFLIGSVTSYNPATGTLVLLALDLGKDGTYVGIGTPAWNIALSSRSGLNSSLAKVTATTAPMVITAGALLPASYPTSTVLEVVGTTTGNARVIVDAFAGGGYFGGRRAGGSSGSLSAISGTDVITGIEARGYDGGVYSSSQATILLSADGTWNLGSSYPTRMDFKVTPVGSTTIATAVSVQNDGIVLVNQPSASGTYKLQVTGGTSIDDLTVTDNLTVINELFTARMECLGGVMFIVGANTANGGSVEMYGGTVASSTINSGPRLYLQGGIALPSGTRKGGNVQLVGGPGGGGATGNGGDVLIAGANAISTSGSGGSLVVSPSTATGTGSAGGTILRTTVLYRQSTPTALTTSATLTSAQVLTGILTANQGAAGAAAYQLPLASDLQLALPVAHTTDDAFTFSVINISTVAAEAVSITTNTGWTLVGDMDVQANSAATTKSTGRFTARRTGSNTFTLYRIA